MVETAAAVAGASAPFSRDADAARRVRRRAAVVVITALRVVAGLLDAWPPQRQ